MIGKLALGAILATGVVLKDGIIEINVQEKHPNGSHVHMFVPATVATWGIHLAPEKRLAEHLRGKADELAVAHVALRELEKLPDSVLVQVDNSEQHVRIATRSGNFVVDVDDSGETVHINVPIRAARKVLEQLQADAPTI